MSWGSVFFGSIGLLLQALAIGCAYESYAVGSGKDPTISRIVAFQFVSHPRTYIIGVFIAGVILGSVVTHFANWTVKQ